MSTHLRLPPTEMRLPCSENQHTLRWADGHLSAPDHDDIDGELALQALSGEPQGCGRIVSAWRNAVCDPRLLTLATRGKGDQLQRQHSGSFGWVRYAGSGRRAARRAAMASTLVHSVPAPFPGGMSGTILSGQEPGEADPLLLLLRMPALRDRLLHDALAGWQLRLAEDDVDSALLPTLTAALLGRVRYCASLWLGNPKTPVEVEMLPVGSRPSFASDGSGEIRIGVPFTWLTDVWAAELTAFCGRFTLAVDRNGNVLTLDTVGPDLDRAPVQIRLPGEVGAAAAGS